MKDREKSKSKLTQPPTMLRRHFITGILVMVPAAVSAWVLYRLFAWVDGLMWHVWSWFGLSRDISFVGGIPGVGIVTVILLILLVGLLVNNYLGRRLYQIYDRTLTRIPLFNKIYTALKQIGEAVLSKERTVFRAVGMIEYPRRGIWCLVFITDFPSEEMMTVAGERLRSVFLPTTPNPTSGFFLMIPEKELHPLAISVEDGLKMVISGGAVVPGETILPSGKKVPRTPGKRRWWQRGSAGTVVPAPSPGEPDPGIEESSP